MSNYKHFKHYYDPYDSLDVEWQNVVSKGHLTIREVVSLSGYTKSYVYRLVKDGVIPCMNGKSGKQVRWIDFIHWYSHLTETPASPHRRGIVLHRWLDKADRHGKVLAAKVRDEIRCQVIQRWLAQTL